MLKELLRAFGVEIVVLNHEESKGGAGGEPHNGSLALRRETLRYATIPSPLLSCSLLAGIINRAKARRARVGLERFLFLLQ
jgi:hypothetical protein